VRHVELQGDLLYLGNGYEFQVYDVSSPDLPVLVSSTPLASNTGALRVVGPTAYIAANGTDGVMVVDVSNPSAPTIRGAVQVLGGVYDIEIRGTTAFVTDGEYGMRIVDTTRTTDPLLGRTEMPRHGSRRDMVLDDAVAYLPLSKGTYSSQKAGLQVVDLSDPAAPSEIAFYPSWESMRCAEKVGDYLYVGGDDMRVFDVSEPSTPLLIGYLHPDHSTLDMEIVGSTLYAAASDAHLQIYDISNPQRFSLIRSVDPSDRVGAYDIAVVGDRLYITDVGDGFYIYGIAQPHNPVLLGYVGPLAYARELVVVGTTVYIADGGDGLVIMDVSDPTTPVTLGVYDTPSLATGLIVEDGIAYIADDESVQMVDVTDPTNPRLLGWYAHYDVSLIGKFPGTDVLFMAAETRLFSALDVSDSCTPPCIADMTSVNSGIGHPAYGVPDGAVSAADIQYYVNAWVAGDLAIADLTTQNASVGDPLYGVPDGEVTAADLNYFVNAWVEGCP